MASQIDDKIADLQKRLNEVENTLKKGGYTINIPNWDKKIEDLKQSINDLRNASMEADAKIMKRLDALEEKAEKK